MEEIIRKLRIHTLKAQAELRRLRCAQLAGESENARTFGERDALARQLYRALEESYIIQLAIDLFERQEREGRVDSDFGMPR